MLVTRFNLWGIRVTVHFSSLSAYMAFNDEICFLIKDNNKSNLAFHENHLKGFRNMTTKDKTDEILDRVIRKIMQMKARDLLFFHGSAVSKDRKAILFIGPRGSGKTTLALYSLLHRYKILCNEIVAIDKKNLFIHPYHMPFYIEPRVMRTLEMLRPLDFHYNKRTVRFLTHDKEQKPCIIDKIFLLKKNSGNNLKFLLSNSMITCDYITEGILELSNNVSCNILPSLGKITPQNAHPLKNRLDKLFQEA